MAKDGAGPVSYTHLIENEVAENLDFSSLIKEFADRKARNVKFC